MKPLTARARWVILALLVAAAALMVLRPRSRPAAYRGGTLRWGGDAGGGAPYLIDRGPGRPPAGFESELADYLADRLGVPADFRQNDWDVLPWDLRRGEIDLILNGYEWTPHRQRTMAASLPYYLYRLQLIVAPGSPIRGWDDLRRSRSGRRLRVGVLSDSAAQRHVEREYGDDVDIDDLSAEGSTGLLTMVRNGQLDATVQDALVAVWYVQQKHGFEDLRLVGEPAAPGYFVLFVRPEDGELLQRLNEALRAALRDGTLKRIYQRYGLWNADQEGLTKAAEDWPPQPEEEEPTLADCAILLLKAAGVTVVLACLAMPLAMLLGLLVAVGRLYGPLWARVALTAYVELLRGTPVLMQLIVIYYLLPYVGLRLDAFWAGVLGLAVNYSAYEAENYRAGLLAIPRGQMEAALALGMSRRTALYRILVPQAVRLVIPPVTNDFISLFKDTSICGVLAVAELTKRSRSLTVNYPQYVYQVLFLTALLYLLMSYPLSLLARRLERRRA